jgi:hypothetical protein
LRGGLFHQVVKRGEAFLAAADHGREAVSLEDLDDALALDSLDSNALVEVVKEQIAPGRIIAQRRFLQKCF